MTIAVDIADRLYDYTDEDEAAKVIARFQDEMGLSDEIILSIWSDFSDPRHSLLETRVIAAIDANGTVKRAQESIPAEIHLVAVSQSA